MTLTSILAAAISFLSVGDTLATNKMSDATSTLNAASASAPREIPVGLPETGSGSEIYEDGIPVAYGATPIYPYYHWSGGNSYASQGLIKPVEAVIRSETVGYVIDSYSRTFADVLSGRISATTSTNGLIRFDGNISGPISRGWSFMAGAYVNLDPTSVNAPKKRFVENKQIYKVCVSKKWSDSDFFINYKFSKCDDAVQGYSFAPFIYNGDGSISSFNGFKIGRDCYFPENDGIEIVDVISGQKTTGSLGKMDNRNIHDIVIGANFQTQAEWKISPVLHLSFSPAMNYLTTGLSGVDANGDETGNNYIQNRLAILYKARYTHAIGEVAFSKKFERNNIKISIFDWYANEQEAGSSSLFAHTVSANPSRISKSEQYSWDYNTNSTFYNGWMNEFGVYAFDEWRPVPKLGIKFGTRFALYSFNVFNANNPSNETYNKRVPGFYLDNGTARLNNSKGSKFNFAVSASASYNCGYGLSIVAEGLFRYLNRTISSYKGTVAPSTEPVRNAFGRLGVVYENNWIQSSVVASYISSRNSTKILNVTKQVYGKSETQSYTALYDVVTPALILDNKVHFGGFNMRVMCTLQNPKYQNYDNVFVFSDNQSVEVCYSGKYVTGISRLMLELEPSFNIRKWNFWLSVRYFSRQYVSRTNLAFFNGHWETFGGIDWSVTPKIKLSLSLVNLLFQYGATGSIDVADTITDPNQLNNIVMSGKYIRPFSVDIGVKVNL